MPPWIVLLFCLLVVTGVPAARGDDRPKGHTAAGKKAAKKAERSASQDTKKRNQINKLLRGYAKDLAGAPEISPRRAAALVKAQNAILLDVRDAKEQRVSMIPGAIPHSRYLAKPERYAGRPVVAYCTIGYRSGKLVKQLRKGGVTAFNMRGSILSWLHAGKPLVGRDGKRTRKVHVYGKTWDLAPAGITTVW